VCDEQRSTKCEHNRIGASIALWRNMSRPRARARLGRGWPSCGSSRQCVSARCG
jgi:hypothetical protein